jgi:hypothetical protein
MATFSGDYLGNFVHVEDPFRPGEILEATGSGPHSSTLTISLGDRSQTHWSTVYDPTWKLRPTFSEALSRCSWLGRWEV